MDDVNSSGEVELLSSMNLRDDSVDMSIVENELIRIKNSKTLDESNIVEVLEDCITDSTVSISELVEYSNNISRTSVKNNFIGDKSNSAPTTVGNNVEGGNNSNRDNGRAKVDDKNLTITINDYININLSGNKLNIVIQSQSNSIDNKLKVALFLVVLLILIK